MFITLLEPAKRKKLWKFLFLFRNEKHKVYPEIKSNTEKQIANEM